jgi:hypothetical protein
MKPYTRLNSSKSCPYLQFFGDSETDADFLCRAQLFVESAMVLTQDHPRADYDERDEAACLDRMMRDYAALSRVTGIRCDLWESAMNQLRDYHAFSWDAEMRAKVCILFLDTAFRWREVDAATRYQKWLTCPDKCLLPVSVRLFTTPFDMLAADGVGDPTDVPCRAVALTLEHIRSRIVNPVIVSKEAREVVVQARQNTNARAASTLSLHLNALESKDPDTSGAPLRRLILRYAHSLEKPDHRREMVDSALHDSIPKIQSFLR